MIRKCLVATGNVIIRCAGFKRSSGEGFSRGAYTRSPELFFQSNACCWDRRLQRMLTSFERRRGEFLLWKFRKGIAVGFAMTRMLESTRGNLVRRRKP